MKLLPLSILITAAVAAPFQSRGNADQVCDNPGRVVSIVLDASSSTEGTDPQKLRVRGGIDLLDYLTSQSKASDRNKADTVSIVSFDGYATVKYSQGDPNEQARQALESIGSDGGTFIARGVQAGLDQILGSNPGSKGGLVLFTDGEDNTVDAVVEQIKRASDAGVRVSIGQTTLLDEHEVPARKNSGGIGGSITYYLQSFSDMVSGRPKTVKLKGIPLDTRISQAALVSGGTVSIIQTPDAQAEFVQQVIKNGITNQDGKCSGNDIGDSGGPLIRGVSSLGLCSKNAESVFTYSPKSQNEQLAFAVSLISNESPVNIEATFTNKATGQTSTINVNKANANGKLSGTASPGHQCEVRIKTTNADSNACQYSVTLATTSDVSAPEPSSAAPQPSSAAPAPSSAAPAPSSASPAPSSVPPTPSSAPSAPSSVAPSPSSSAVPSQVPSSECPPAPAASTVTSSTTVTVTASVPSATPNVCICKCDAPGAKPLPKIEL